MKACARALAACLVLLAQPLSAQDSASQPTLEELVPDAALEDPEGWAGGDRHEGTERDGESRDDSVPPPVIDTPLEAMPLVTVPAPEEVELPRPQPLEPVEIIDFADFDATIPPLPEGREERVSRELRLVFPADEALLPEREAFLRRFRSLSTIEQLDSADNYARLAAQARADEQLLQRMLRTYGYFDGQVIRTVGPEADSRGDGSDQVLVRFELIPGERFRVGTVDLGAFSQAGADYASLRGAYEVFPGDPLLLDRITNERLDLDQALGESGYPFAVVAEPELLVDHARAEGDVTMAVMPNGKYVFGNVTSSMEDFLSGRHLARIARFAPGETYRRSDQQDLRRAILATGLVSSVTLTPVETSPPADGQPGTVDIAAEITEAPLRTIAGNIGYGTEEGFRLEASWEHRNLFPPEGMLRLRGIAGTQEQLAGVTFRRNNFRGRDHILTLDAYASTLDYDAYDARTVALVGSFEHASTLLFQKRLSWGVGMELLATGEREADATGAFGPRETYLVAAASGQVQFDTSDDLLDPGEGVRLAARLSPEFSRHSGVESFYLRGQADAAAYASLGENVVLAGRVRLASIAGAGVADIAPSRRLYAGGGGSVRGYGYHEIGPRNVIGDPTGGRSLAEASLEARIRTGLFDGALGFVPFLDAGTVDEGPFPGFERIQFGAGIGLRYHSAFGPIRVDVAAPLNPGPDDAPVAVHVALGQAF